MSILGDVVRKEYDFKLDTLQKMLLNVCENVYKLNAGMITAKQLLSVVNGCLSGETIDKFTWKYLTPSEEKEAKINTDIIEIQKNYLNDVMAYLHLDDIDTEFDEINKENNKQ